MAIRNLSDIAAIETVPLAERGLPQSSYAALASSAKRTPDAKALSFFLSADRLDETHVWTYAEFLATSHAQQTLLRPAALRHDRPVAFVSAQLAGTHFSIWGGEAAGAVLAINPMLEPKQIANLLGVAQSLGPCHARPGSATRRHGQIWSAELASLPS